MSSITVSAPIDTDFDRAVETAKLSALYNFAYGLSHEINNPLANIATRAQTLLADEKDPERRRKLATIVQQAFRAHEMIADLMLFARPPVLRRESTDLVKLTDTVLAELQATARDQGTELVRMGDPGPLIVNIDPTHISVALKAILQNSLEAINTDGRVEVSVRSIAETCDTAYAVPSTEYLVPGTDCLRIDTAHLAEARGASHPQSLPYSPLSPPYSLISVSDTGPGIPAHIRPHIFDPFYCGREAGRGLGLGLSKARRVISLHGGYIHVESTPSCGATFTIAIPESDDHSLKS